VGSSEIGSCVGLIIGETEGRRVVGVRTGDNDGQNVVGLELLNASDGDGVGGSVAIIVGKIDVTVSAGALVVGDGSAIVTEKTGVGSGVTADDEGAGVGSSEKAGVGLGVNADDGGAVVGFHVLSSGSSFGLFGSGSVTVLSVSMLVKFCVAIFAYCSQ